MSAKNTLLILICMSLAAPFAHAQVPGPEPAPTPAPDPEPPETQDEVEPVAPTGVTPAPESQLSLSQILAQLTVATEAVAKMKEVTEAPEADKLRTPDSPAFVLLGVSPSQIQKPTTPRDLAVALTALVSEDADLQVPENIAIEVSPYWLAVGPRVTYDEVAKGGGIQVLRNLSISLATTEVADDGTRRLGVGFRTSIAAGGEPGCGKDVTAIDAKLKALANANALGPTAIRKLRDQFLVNGELDEEGLAEAAAPIKAELAAASDLNAEASKIQKACLEVPTVRPRSLSFAGALAWRFPTEEVEDGDLVAQSYWLTYAHTIGPTSIMVLGRAQFEEATKGWDGFGDLGARAVVARNSYAGSLEFVVRRQVHGDGSDDAPTQLRAAVQAEYMIKDGTWLTVTFGKEFEASEAGSLFSLANLTTTFGEPTITK